MALIRLSPANLLRRFRRDRKASAAIGFAFCAIPFFASMGAIIECATTFFFTQIIETATADASRLIMTGQAQNAKLNAAQFKAQVCGRLPPLFDCQSDVVVDVDVATNFGAADVAALSQAMMTATPKYNPGIGGDIVVVRVAYAKTVWMDVLGAGFANTTDGKRILMGVAAFKNEPFPTPTP
jgi:Flp pilus assembly protein TadG